MSTLWEVIRIRWSQEGAALRMKLVPSSEDTREPALSLSRPWEDTGRCGHLQNRRTSSHPKPNHAATLILDVQPLELWKNKLPLGKPRRSWYFVMASQTDWDSVCRGYNQCVKRAVFLPGTLLGSFPFPFFTLRGCLHFLAHSPFRHLHNQQHSAFQSLSDPPTSFLVGPR